MDASSVSFRSSMSSVNKEKQRRHREQSVEQASAARHHDRQKSSRPNKKQSSSRIRVATNRFSKSTPLSRKAELDYLHEKKLVKVLTQHFSILDPSVLKSINYADLEEAEKSLMKKVQDRAKAAEQDGVMEEAALQVELAEQNARMMEQVVDWVTLSNNDAAAENSQFPVENESRLDINTDSAMSAEMRLAAFLQAGNDVISSNTSAYDEETSSFSASTAVQEASEAVTAAEKAAKKMAEAVSFTSQSESEEEEQWFAYWSEEHQRECYYEPKSGKVSWTIPDMSTPTITTSYQEASNAVSEGAAMGFRSLPTVQEASTYNSDHPPSWQDFIEASPSSDTVARRERRRKRRMKRLIRRVIYAVVLFSTIIAATMYSRYFNIDDSAAKALSRLERNRNLRNSLAFMPSYEDDIISSSSSSSAKLEKSSTRQERFEDKAEKKENI